MNKELWMHTQKKAEYIGDPLNLFFLLSIFTLKPSKVPTEHLKWRQISYLVQCDTTYESVQIHFSIYLFFW